jgi:hypothetical protein
MSRQDKIHLHTHQVIMNLLTKDRPWLCRGCGEFVDDENPDNRTTQGYCSMCNRNHLECLICSTCGSHKTCGECNEMDKTHNYACGICSLPMLYILKRGANCDFCRKSMYDVPLFTCPRASRHPSDHCEGSCAHVTHDSHDVCPKCILQRPIVYVTQDGERVTTPPAPAAAPEPEQEPEPDEDEDEDEDNDEEEEHQQPVNIIVQEQEPILDRDDDNVPVPEEIIPLPHGTLVENNF